MTKKLLLVDLENKHKVDLSPLGRELQGNHIRGCQSKPAEGFKEALALNLLFSLNDGLGAKVRVRKCRKPPSSCSIPPPSAMRQIADVES